MKEKVEKTALQCADLIVEVIRYHRIIPADQSEVSCKTEIIPDKHASDYPQDHGSQLIVFYIILVNNILRGCALIVIPVNSIHC